MRREDHSSTNNCDVRKTKNSGVRRAELQLQQQCEKCGAKSAPGFQIRLSVSCVAIPGVVGRLEERVLHLARLVLHNLLNQVPVDLAQAAVEHLASLEHVEDAIREHLLAVHGSIDVEQELAVAEV